MLVHIYSFVGKKDLSFNEGMDASISTPPQRSLPLAGFVCLAGMMSLAIAMGVGRFAFTPLFPLMVRDGVLTNGAGAILAASNYLGYLVGAITAARLPLSSARLKTVGLLGTVAVTAGVGLTHSTAIWVLLRFFAGAVSAWGLIATTAWGLAWLGELGRQRLAGVMFAGVGIGIAAVGMFCLVAAGPAVPSARLWIELGLLSAVAVVVPVAAAEVYPIRGATVRPLATMAARAAPLGGTWGLIICYSLFGFGYILPATYLPAQARQLVDDPQVFGWAWPAFGLAGAASTLVVALWFSRARRVRLWCAAQGLMGIGVIAPVIHLSLASVICAALFVGGTFMVITMVAMQEARVRGGNQATAILARMTAGFAIGQLAGPTVCGVLGYFTRDAGEALRLGLILAAVGLFGSSLYLATVVRRPEGTTDGT